MADRSRCPSCGERVSPYAAGCAVCGADLDTGLWDSGPGVGQRVASALNAVSFGAIPGWLVVVVALLVVGYLLR
jgi:hypothetical protein